MNDQNVTEGFGRGGGQRTRFLPPPLFCRRGVTLVELMVVIIVMGVLSTVAYTSMSGSQNETIARGAARRVACDIAFAQADAIALHEKRTVKFKVNEDKYTIRCQGELLFHPVTRTEYRVKLRTTYPNSGIDLYNADFGGADSLDFDEDGICSAGGQVFIDVGDNTWSVSVADQTGHITITQES